MNSLLQGIEIPPAISILAIAAAFLLLIVVVSLAARSGDGRRLAAEVQGRDRQISALRGRLERSQVRLNEVAQRLAPLEQALRQLESRSSGSVPRLRLDASGRLMEEQ